MTIETRCAGCGTILTIVDQFAGRQARCPHCQTEYTVPEQTDEATLDAVCHFCGAAVDAVKQVESIKICATCQASIEENQADIQAETQSAGQSHRLLIGAVVIGAGMCLIYFVVRVIRDYLGP